MNVKLSFMGDLRGLTFSRISVGRVVKVCGRSDEAIAIGLEQRMKFVKEKMERYNDDVEQSEEEVRPDSEDLQEKEEVDRANVH